jgi:murein DD-endopeptidase MepM/ murein hydrolase activator NlpD
MRDSLQTKNSAPAVSLSSRFLLIGAWLLALSLVVGASYLGWQVTVGKAAQLEITSATSAPTQMALIEDPGQAELPPYVSSHLSSAINRLTDMHTIIPTRPREEAVLYTVTQGDSVFGIALEYNISPETVLWANYDLLRDNPDSLSPGMELNIPPVNGVYYQWQEGDTLEGVAGTFKAEAKDILSWPGNKLDLTNPVVEPGQWVMVPEGEREFQQWIVPQIAREKSGVSKSVYGPGACEGSYEGAYGSGFFAWPTASHFLSGNDYWSGHLGIDIAGALGDGTFASDSGVVVFAGWSTTGYGNMVMIDHGNGYLTLYGHMSQVSTSCGASVYQGGYIGAVGSTGNSTGAHLHFEVRYMGGFINPWYVLPAP